MPRQKKVKVSAKSKKNPESIQEIDQTKDLSAKTTDPTKEACGADIGTTNNADDEYSCKNCNSYFPLLKSFILHLESSHVNKSDKDGIERYKCEVCSTEFDCSVVLGKHALEHVSGGAGSVAEKQIVQSEEDFPKNSSTKDSTNESSSATDSVSKAIQVSGKTSSRRRGRPPKRGKGPKLYTEPVNITISSFEKPNANQSMSETASDEPKCSKTSKDNEGDARRESFDLVRPREEHEATEEESSVEHGNLKDGQHEERKVDSESEDNKVEKSGESTSEKRKRNSENQCIVCLQKFTTKESLRQHRLTHGDKEKWPCSSCNREFPSHWKYHEHCVKAHNNKKPFQCDECGKRLSSFTILATHKGLHSGSRPYACELCGKRYLVAAGLKDHLIAHKNERNHRCDDCGAAFNARGDLKKHMITHMNEKPHNCSVCNAGFNRAASLRRHMRSHTGEKPYKCDLCEKSFSRKEKMHEHRRTHTGERPLRCPHCSKSFKDSSNFSNHKKIHSAGYIPRKRKRASIMKNDESNIGGEEEPLDSVNATGALEEPVAAAPEMLPATGPIEMTENCEENALKDFATISMATEGLQATGQELFRQILGAVSDPNDLRNLAAAQNVAGAAGSFHLSPVDLRSLQMIINGVQARNPANLAANGTQNIAGLCQNVTSISQ